MIGNFIPSPPVDIFNESPNQLISRVLAPISLWEFGSLCFTLLMSGAFIYLGTTEYDGFRDYSVYINAGRGNYVTWTGYYYAYWALPLFKLISYLPPRVGLLSWSVLNVLGIFLGARVFGNNRALVLLSYQTLSVLFSGQYTGIMIGGLGILWIGLKLNKWFLASLGFLVASTKYHTGGFVSLFLLTLCDEPTVKKFRVGFSTAVFALISLMVYPRWPIDVVHRLQSIPPDNHTVISLWRWIGPFVLVLWVSPLVFSMRKIEKLYLLISSLCVATPYFQQQGLLILLIFPIGWITWLSFLGYTQVLLPMEWLRANAVIPVGVYVNTITSAYQSILGRIIGEKKSTT